MFIRYNNDDVNWEDNNPVTDKIMWKNFKNLTNNNKQVPPRNINHNGKFITSL